MTFFEAITTVFRKYAEFGGRATRSEFWWFTLFSALVGAALNSVSWTVTNGTVFDWTHPGSVTTGSVKLAGLWSIVVLLPSLAVTIRRLRDAGREWTELFWLLLPIAGLIVLIVHLCDPSVPALLSAPEPPTKPTAAKAARPPAPKKPKE